MKRSTKRLMITAAALVALAVPASQIGRAHV